MQLRKTRGSLYNFNYHFEWIPHEIEILSLSIQPDHDLRIKEELWSRTYYKDVRFKLHLCGPVGNIAPWKVA